MVGESTGPPQARMRLFTEVDGICERIRLQRWMSLFRPAPLWTGWAHQGVCPSLHAVLGALSGGQEAWVVSHLAPSALPPLLDGLAQHLQEVGLFHLGEFVTSFATALWLYRTWARLPRHAGLGALRHGQWHSGKGGPMGGAPMQPSFPGQGEQGFESPWPARPSSPWAPLGRQCSLWALGVPCSFRFPLLP